MLTTLFLTVLNISLAAVPLMAALLLLRALFKKRLPRRLFYAAWALVLLRLALPFSLPSDASFYNLLPREAISQNGAATAVALIRDSGQTVDFPVLDYPWDDNPAIDHGDAASSIDEPAGRPVIRRAALDRNLMLAIIWACGAAGLLLFGIFGYCAVLRRVRRESLPLSGNVWLSDLFQTPVVCGLLHSRIILPMTLDTRDRDALSAVLAHERTHIHRRDNLWRMLAALTLYLHWFNPLVWLCYCAFIRDMEVSCDEAVLAASRQDIRGEYAESLLRLAKTEANPLYGGLLSFGESGIKERVERIMSYKKVQVLLIVLGCAVLAALGIIFLTNPARQAQQSNPAEGLPYTLEALGTEADGGIVYDAGAGLALTLRLSNHSDAPLYFDGRFALEYYDGSSWTPLALTLPAQTTQERTVAAHAAVSLLDGSSTDFAGIPAEAFAAPPTPGNYRISISGQPQEAKSGAQEPVTLRAYFRLAAEPAQPDDAGNPAESQPVSSPAPEGNAAKSLYPYLYDATGDSLNAVYVLDSANYAYHLVEDKTLLDAILAATRGKQAEGDWTSGDGSVLLFGDWLDSVRLEFRFDSAKNTGLSSLCAAAVKDTPAHAQWLASMNPEKLLSAEFSGSYNAKTVNLTTASRDGLTRIAAYLKEMTVQTPPRVYPQGNNSDTPATLYSLKLQFSSGVSYRIFGDETGLCISSSDMGTLSIDYETTKAAIDGLRKLMAELAAAQPSAVAAGLLPAEASSATLYCNAEKTFQYYGDPAALLKTLQGMREIKASALGDPLPGVDTLELVSDILSGKKYTCRLYENGFTIEGSAVEDVTVAAAYSLGSTAAWHRFTKQLQADYDSHDTCGPYWLGLMQPGRVQRATVYDSVTGKQKSYAVEAGVVTAEVNSLVRALKAIRVNTPATKTGASVYRPAEPYALVTVTFASGTTYNVTATEKTVTIVSSDLSYGLSYPLTAGSGDALSYFGNLAQGIHANPETAKPVIYLYPQKTTDVTVKLDFAGKLTYTYPAYQDGWNVTAQPDGTLTNRADGSTHYYLFWEGAADAAWAHERGFVVAGTETEAFLRETLADLGLTPREYNDFITYWAPKMQGNAYNLISFSSAEEYGQKAALTVTPQPDSILRVHMVWQALDAPIFIPPQTLAPFVRRGFTLVEWGGTEVFE